MEPPDFSREQTVALFRDAANAALKDHWGLPGTDGTGIFRIFCACPRGAFTPDAWMAHIRSVAARAIEVKPAQR
jgi:hypothetical protein